MKSLLAALCFCVASVAYAQDKPSPPERTPADGPFVPEAALPGGEVISLYAPDSPLLKQDRIHEAEKYNTTGHTGPKLLNTLNIHNPSIEVHLAEDRGKTGTAIIIAPGGGHKILWVGPEGYDLVPFFAKFGVSTIVLRNRLRVDGYEPTTDAVNDAFQAIPHRAITRGRVEARSRSHRHHGILCGGRAVGSHSVVLRRVPEESQRPS